jgi:hypothetical protein
MLGDFQDMARRMLTVLPRNWFGDAPPILGAVLNGLGTAMAAVYALIQAVIQQSRILTATCSYLDAVAVDFFGNTLERRLDEADTPFRTRICEELLRSRATRAALNTGLVQLTGRAPVIFEPARSSDTGGYNLGGVGYCLAGGWGCLNLPYQFFLTIFRPQGGGIAQLAGYGSPGVPVYGSLTMEVAGISDSELFAAVPPLLPVATIAWCRLSS